MITITVDDRAVLQALQALRQHVENLTPALRDAGEYLLRSHIERWSSGRAPDGTPWQPLTPKHAARKAKKRPAAPLLVYDDLLRGLLDYQVVGDTLELGTNRIYGAIHQFGGSPGMAPGPAAIPARPFLGLSRDDEDEVVDILRRHLARAMG